MAPPLPHYLCAAAGIKEGLVDISGLQARKVGVIGFRGHFASLITISHEMLAEKAPEVSFIPGHEFPGVVRSGIRRDSKGATMFILWAVFKVIRSFVCISYEESGQIHLFLATRAMYPPDVNRDSTSGVPFAVKDGIAREIRDNIGNVTTLWTRSLRVEVRNSRSFYIK